MDFLYFRRDHLQQQQQQQLFILFFFVCPLTGTTHLFLYFYYLTFYCVYKHRMDRFFSSGS